MKLPEAIALMLEGKVMVDKWGQETRCRVDGDLAYFEIYFGERRGWSYTTNFAAVFQLEGWREATPEELKEIGA